MIIKNKGIYFVLLLIMIVSKQGLSASPIGRQTFVGGTYVQFHVNSFDKYNNGTELKDWTRVRVKIENLPAGTNWRYFIFARDTEIPGEMAPNSLDLDYLKIKIVSVNTSFDAANIIFETNAIELSSSPYLFVSGTGSGDFEILVSYELGADPTKVLLGQRADYYHVDLEFHLESD